MNLTFFEMNFVSFEIVFFPFFCGFKFLNIIGNQNSHIWDIFMPTFVFSKKTSDIINILCRKHSNLMFSSLNTLLFLYETSRLCAKMNFARKNVEITKRPLSKLFCICFRSEYEFRTTNTDTFGLGRTLDYIWRCYRWRGQLDQRGEFLEGIADVLCGRENSHTSTRTRKFPFKITGVYEKCTLCYWYHFNNK